MADLIYRIAPATELSAAERRVLIELCEEAYEEEFPTFFEDFPGSVHILAYMDAVAVSHACWVTRWLQPGEHRPLRTAYVELVATRPAYQGRGYASALLRRMVDELADFELGGLSPSDPAFYARVGWESWRGPRMIRTETGLLPTPGEDVMILRLPKTPPLDLDGPLSAEWRPGEMW
jgi:aminoglycoside 2'-N-acetyltransferase I